MYKNCAITFNLHDKLFHRVATIVVFNNGLSINKNFDEKKKSKVPKFSHQKWVECEMKKKIKTLSAHRFLKVELVPQFRKFLNV